MIEFETDLEKLNGQVTDLTNRMQEVKDSIQDLRLTENQCIKCSKKAKILSEKLKFSTAAKQIQLGYSQDLLNKKDARPNKLQSQFDDLQQQIQKLVIECKKKSKQVEEPKEQTPSQQTNEQQTNTPSPTPPKASVEILDDIINGFNENKK